MSLRIAIAGKGGTGKSTFSALLCRSLLAKGIKPLLAVDADPNSCLPEKLGIEAEQTIGELREELRREPEKKPAGIPKGEWMEGMINRAIIESTGLDMVVMGRQEGPDCYCFINNLLRQCLDQLGKQYEAVVIDNEAGLEHLSRRTNGSVEVLVVVAHPTIAGARTALRIMEIVKSLHLDVGNSFLVLNQADAPLDAELTAEFARTGIEIVGSIPTDPVIRDYELKAQSLLTAPAGSKAAMAVDEILEKILKGGAHENAGRGQREMGRCIERGRHRRHQGAGRHPHVDGNGRRREDPAVSGVRRPDQESPCRGDGDPRPRAGGLAEAAAGRPGGCREIPRRLGEEVRRSSSARR